LVIDYVVVAKWKAIFAMVIIHNNFIINVFLYIINAIIASIFCSNVCLFARTILLHMTKSMAAMALNGWRASCGSHIWCTLGKILHMNLTRIHSTRNRRWRSCKTCAR
jgi:hypothetical protein